jgi:hypothetical protein
VWWRWHNGTLVYPRKREAEISPYRHPLPLQEAADLYAALRRPMTDLHGMGAWLITALDASDEYRAVRCPRSASSSSPGSISSTAASGPPIPDGTWIIDHDRRLPPDVLKLAIY